MAGLRKVGDEGSQAIGVNPLAEENIVVDEQVDSVELLFLEFML